MPNKQPLPVFAIIFLTLFFGFCWFCLSPVKGETLEVFIDSTTSPTEDAWLLVDYKKLGKWEVPHEEKEPYPDSFFWDGKNPCFSLQALTSRGLSVRNDRDDGFDKVYLCLKKSWFGKYWTSYFRTKP